MLGLSDYEDTGQARIYDIEAISLPIVYNKFGDHDPNGLMYVLKQDSERIQKKARELFALPTPQPYEEVRPLVIRANVGDTVQINFENKLKPSGIYPCTGTFLQCAHLRRCKCRFQSGYYNRSLHSLCLAGG